jgi:amidase
LGVDGLLAMPSTPTTAPPIPGSVPAPSGAAADRAAIVRLTCLAPVCGAPALSVPVAELDGLPLGLSLLAAPGRDESLLTIAELLG